MDLSGLFATLATQALIEEVSCGPKPGLVDRYDSGAHTDMDLDTFLTSASALKPYFRAFCHLSFNSPESDPSAVLPGLRRIGMRAEGAMFKATDGVNTHKGAIFSMGLLVSAACFLLGKQIALLTPQLVCLAAGRIAGNIVSSDLNQPKLNKPLEHLTRGERLFMACGLAGIRGEAQKGFPNAYAGYKYLQYSLSRADMSKDQALCATLLYLITLANDTVVIGKHGIETMNYLREQAGWYLKQNQIYTPNWRDELQALNADFSAQGISPGGCADLLAASIFLLYLDKLQLGSRAIRENTRSISAHGMLG